MFNLLNIRSNFMFQSTSAHDYGPGKVPVKIENYFRTKLFAISEDKPG